MPWRDEQYFSGALWTRIIIIRMIRHDASAVVVEKRRMASYLLASTAGCLRDSTAGYLPASTAGFLRYEASFKGSV